MNLGVQNGRNSTRAGGVVLCVIVGVFAYGGWQIFEKQRQSGCAACGRAVDGHALTIAAVDGEEQRFCCPACAFSVERQSGSTVRLVSLSHHDGGGSIDPSDAFVVVGSSVNHCLRSEPLVGSQKRFSHLEYDRCSPSMMSFADERAARAFATQYGGKVTMGNDLPRLAQAD